MSDDVVVVAGVGEEGNDDVPSEEISDEGLKS